MIGRRSAIGLCMLCALAFSALAAQGAHAATEGTTLFTCKPVEKKPNTEGFSKPHCKAGDAVSTNAEYEQFSIPAETTTEITGTSEDTEGKCQPWTLKSTQAGVVEEFTSPCAHILLENEGEKSWVTNKKDPTTGEHYFEGTAWIDLTNVVVEKPEGKGCSLANTTLLWHVKFTTKGVPNHEIKFEPATGSTISSFEVKGCSVAALNGAYKLEGSFTATMDGSTLTTTEAGVTTQNTLKLRGQKAGVEGEMTVKGTDKAAGDETDTPLSPTTVITL